MPVQRAEPPYVQIANHYRRLILDGEVTEGDQLPTSAEIGQEWQVAPSTAARGIGQLAVEGYVRVLARGTFVEPLRSGADTPFGRITRVRQTGHLAATGEMEIVRVAELIRIPLYVAELLDLDPKDNVLRRESVTVAGRKPRAEPVALSVQWYRPEFAKLAPELLETKPVRGGAIAAIEKATGKRVVHGEDHFHGRSADEREAHALGVKIGAPILAAAYLWRDAEGAVLEYGEFVLPERRTLRYDYDLNAVTQ